MRISKSILQQRLLLYITPESDSYDPIFAALLAQEAPHWQRTRRRKAPAANKAKLLRMARAGEERPRWNSPLGRALTNYTTGSNKNRDAEFTVALRNVNRDWLDRGPNGRRRAA